jgi:hypothetical protein
LFENGKFKRYAKHLKQDRGGVKVRRRFTAKTGRIPQQQKLTASGRSLFAELLSPHGRLRAFEPSMLAELGHSPF